MAWYAIRSIYHFGTKADGTNIFEERTVCFEAETSDEAHEKAAYESQQYAEDNELIAHNEQVAYKQDGENLIDGYEVWSELFESRESLSEFWSNRYEKYTYHPEP
jgi:hypothetical protein